MRIYSSWTKLHTELVCLKRVCLKNDYPENISNKCFKESMDNIHVVKETNPTAEKKPLALGLPYVGSISLKTKFKKSLKNVLNCCKLFLKILLLVSQRSYFLLQCGLCNESYYGEYIRHLNVRIGEHIGI